LETREYTIKELDRINSKEINKRNEEIYTDISNLFDENFETLGKIELINTSLKLIDASNKYILRHPKPLPEFTFRIDVNSPIIYPTSLTDQNKAELNKNFQIVHNKIVNRTRIFTQLSTDGIERFIRPGVSISKSSKNYIFLTKPEMVYETFIEDILTGKLPYLIRFYGQDVKDASLILEIIAQDQVYNYNTLEFNPFPSDGAIELEGIEIEDQSVNISGVPLVFNETNKEERKRSTYIPFDILRGRRMNLNLKSTLRIESLNSVTIGVGLIEAFETVYANKSYFGFAFTPVTNQKLSKIDIKGTWCNNAAAGVVTKIYDNLADFDAVNENYIISIDDTIQGFVNLIGGKPYFFLFEMTADNNYPQTISGIEVTLQ